VAIDRLRTKLNLPAFQPGTWQRNLAVLWLGELIAISGFSITLPFLPYYVQELGITRVDQVAFWVGVVSSSQAVTMALIAPLWGSLADRYGRKIMVERAMFGGAVVIGAMGFTRNVYQLVVLRAIQGTLTGTVPAATTLVASSTPPARRGYALGLLQMSIYLGNSLGPWLGGLIADHLGYRATFWVTGALLFLAGVLVAVGVREAFTSPEGEEDSVAGTEGASGARRRPRLWDGLLLVLRTRALLGVFGIRVLMNTAANVVGPVMALYIQSLAAPGVRIASLTGTITGLASATSAGAAIVLGRVGDRLGPRRVLLACGAAAGLLYGLQAWAQTTTHVLLLRVIAGVALGGILASLSALLAALAPKGRYGAVYGVDTSMMAVANAIAPMLGAALTAGWGLSSVYLGSAVLYAVSTTAVAALIPARSSPSAKDGTPPTAA
jgi:DHA1 family multidrug resistance protein-like MFS transporter